MKDTEKEEIENYKEVLIIDLFKNKESITSTYCRLANTQIKVSLAVMIFGLVVLLLALSSYYLPQGIRLLDLLFGIFSSLLFLFGGICSILYIQIKWKVKRSYDKFVYSTAERYYETLILKSKEPYLSAEKPILKENIIFTSISVGNSI